MKRLTLPILAVSALALSACASLAPYGPQRGPGGQGFVEQRIESDRWRVTYNGVGQHGTVHDYALLRAAELAVANDYQWFEVVQSWTDGRHDGAGGIRPRVSIGAGSSSWGRYRASGVGVGLGFDLSGPQPTSTTLEVVMGRGPRPDGPAVYSARGVIEAMTVRL